MSEFHSLKIPKVLADKIRESKLYKEWGYRSVSEFVLDSGRRRLEELSNDKREELPT